ncbi:MAG: hypothetical protein ACK4FF_00150 [Limnobacter sp.]|uniref:HvfA family oxazolone/thioamide-modified RiPP metallophore n=1 Tax=Limnobacter sp. TaxID=2003368 RepID=UPI00391DD1AE
MKQRTLTRTLLVTGLAMSAGLSAAHASPFDTKPLSQGYQLAQAKEAGTAKPAEGKCGEGKCGGAKTHDKKAAEGKCGEGKCGGAKGSDKKAAEGKCGEGKCGAKK